jgi:hypothetical protein
MIRFTRYLQLYTLHQIERSPYGRREILHIRLSVVHHALRQLPQGLNEQWRADPQAGIEQARELIAPRLAQVLEDDTIQQQLLAPRNWQPYHTLRGQHALPALPPPPTLTPNTSTLSVFDRRLQQAERVLRFTKTALEVANAGLVLWKSWRALRDDQKLVIDALHSTIHGQEQALQNASQSDFVRGYLNAHQHDPVYPAIFDEDDTD